MPVSGDLEGPGGSQAAPGIHRIVQGMSGEIEEGCFGLCTFWLVDVLSLAGRLDEATHIFRNMADHASRLGLFSEQIDPHTPLLITTCRLRCWGLTTCSP